MKSRSVLSGVVASALLLGMVGAAHAAEAMKAKPDATMRLQSKSVAAGVGFSWGDGTLRYKGHTYKLYLKNENVGAWLDGKPDASAPDLICNLDPTTGDTIFGQGLGAYPMNADVVMVGIPNSPMWRTPKGLEVLGPRHFGFDFDYRPLDEIQRSRPKFPTQ